MSDVKKQRQAELNSVYEEIKHTHGIPEALKPKLSCPLLLKIPENWYAGEKRVLVVGQETLGWGFEKVDNHPGPYSDLFEFQHFLSAREGVSALTEWYTAFGYARIRPDNYRSPFWQAYRQIRKAVGNQTDGLDTTVLWTNLFRVAFEETSVVKCGTLEEAKLLHLVSAPILRREIEILNPTAVVFYTGPYYDPYLLGTFEGAKLTAIEGHAERQLAAVSHPSLPPKTYRTYHPAYLNRSRKRG